MLTNIMFNFYEAVDNAYIISKLKEAAIAQRKEFPDPDYGHLFWNPIKKEVHWIVGDSAGGWKEAEKRFKIDGVNKVTVADEYFPSKSEPDWIKIQYR